MRSIKNIQDEINIYGIFSLLTFIGTLLLIGFTESTFNIFITITCFFMLIINLLNKQIEKRQTIIYNEITNKLDYIQTRQKHIVNNLYGIKGKVKK